MKEIHKINLLITALLQFPPPESVKIEHYF
jgi:hypothetical protein